MFDVEAADWAEMLQKNIAFVALLSGFSAAPQGWTAAVQQTQKPWVPETEGQLKYLHQFNSVKNGAAIDYGDIWDSTKGLPWRRS